MSINQLIASANNNVPAAFKDLPEELQTESIHTLILLSLAEDLAQDDNITDLESLLKNGDVTSLATLPNNKILQGKITAKQNGVIAGLPVAQAVFQLVDKNIQFSAKVNDGDQVTSGQLLAEVNGPGRSLLTAERTALNFLGRTSGVANLTHQFVERIADTKANILDTRKTAPGSRFLDKYAVRMGGGMNHRMGLYDMVLIKDNHIDGAGSIQAAVKSVRQTFGNQYQIEVEVKDLQELKQALMLDVDRIMLDNMCLEDIKKAVEITAGRTKLEASGNVSLETVHEIARTGVDFISSGALTHSAPVFDISMRLVVLLNGMNNK